IGEAPGQDAGNDQSIPHVLIADRNGEKLEESFGGFGPDIGNQRAGTWNDSAFVRVKGQREGHCDKTQQATLKSYDYKPVIVTKPNVA
ncbi:MAG: hypothetical protein QOH24_1108, partial [Verrucomicrobiota bacterium]